MASRLRLSRRQILAFRRVVQALDARLPWSPRSLRHAAWAGLQDSMPRAALLSLHARVDGVGPTAWEAPSLAQVWGPRYSAYVIAARDVAVFTLGRLADEAPARRVGEDLAGRLERALGGRATDCIEAARALGESPNRLRYATLTGRVLIRWDGARQPTIRVVERPRLSASDARLELARRFLHVFGPSTARAFAVWAGVPPRTAAQTFSDLRPTLVPVDTPMGEAWMLAEDEPAARADDAAPAPARLLPSGDTYVLLQGIERELLVSEARHREALWTPRVWPGALLVDGEVAGTWRRAGGTATVEPWARVSRRVRQAVEREVAALPLPGLAGPPIVRWVE